MINFCLQMIKLQCHWLVKNLMNGHVPFVLILLHSPMRSSCQMFSRFFWNEVASTLVRACRDQAHSKHSFKQIQKASVGRPVKSAKPTLQRKGKKAKVVCRPCRLVINEVLVYGRYSSTCTPLKWFNNMIFLDREVTCFPWGVLPYMGCIGMCGPKGYGFSAVLVINRVFTITA